MKVEKSRSLYWFTFASTLIDDLLDLVYQTKMSHIIFFLLVDCSATICTEPHTNYPPGSPCGCVLPIQVGLRLNVALYTFFPLVSELAKETAAGVFVKQSQVRIIGANAADQQPEKTVVLIDLVPLEEKFDNTTALSIYHRFWHKQVIIQPSYFGDYEVLYVRYPGSFETQRSLFLCLLITFVFT